MIRPLLLVLLTLLCSAAPAGAITGRTLTQGPPKSKVVALTFDDGPHPYYTEQLLALLQQENVPATFFFVGTMAQSHPDLVLQTADAGHCIANHTFTHRNLLTLSEDEQRREIADCNQVLGSITGIWPRFFRPPGGNYGKRTIEIAGEEGLLTALWSANAGDCLMTDPEALRKKMLSRTTAGGVVLMHSGLEVTLDALPGVIAGLRARGYEFVTLDQLYPAPPPPQSTAVNLLAGTPTPVADQA